MNVSINAKKIQQVVTAETAYVANPRVQPAPPADLERDGLAAPPDEQFPALPFRAGPPWEDLAAGLPEFANDLSALAQLSKVDVNGALNKVRYITEKLLHGLCLRCGVRWGEAEPTLERMIGPLLATGIVPKNVGIHVRTIQTNASPGSHYQESALTSSHVLIAQSALAELLRWFRDSAPRREEDCGGGGEHPNR